MKYEGKIGKPEGWNKLIKEGKLVTSLDEINFNEFIKCSENDPDNGPQLIEYLIYKGFKVLEVKNDPDHFIIEKDKFKKHIRNYQNESIYGNAEYIIFKGWEDDVWFDTITLKSKKINTR